MSIVAAELIAFASANLPTDDTATVGGAIDLNKRPVFTQFTAAAKLAMISDGADTRNVTIYGRLASGAGANEVVALTGAVEVLSVNTYERIQSITAATTSGTRTVTLKQGSGGTTIGTIPINETGVYMMFQNAASEAAGTDRYEKFFWKNTNGSLSLLSAAVKLTADPSSKIKMGLAPSVDDTATATNRKTAPGSVSFVDDNVSQNVPGTNLASGSAIGTWIDLTLTGGDIAYKSTFTTELSGQTT